MQEITMQETESIGGGMSWLVGWAAGQLLTATARYLYSSVVAGDVDYASLAESQGTFYNTVGA